jgi:hypothetical protein
LSPKQRENKSAAIAFKVDRRWLSSRVGDLERLLTHQQVKP